MGLGKVAITAFVVTVLCLTTATWIRRAFRQVSFVTAMMPFAILFAMASLGASTLVIKKSSKMSWTQSSMAKVAIVE